MGSRLNVFNFHLPEPFTLIVSWLLGSIFASPPRQNMHSRTKFIMWPLRNLKRRIPIGSSIFFGCDSWVSIHVWHPPATIKWLHGKSDKYALLSAIRRNSTMFHTDLYASHEKDLYILYKNFYNLHRNVNKNNYSFYLII